MRITTGKYKGRAIQAPKGIRPTQQKVRKAVFDILGDIEGLSFLELFAGSGAVGFEALSRGADSLVLVEQSRNSILAIKRNIEALKPQNCRVLAQETQIALKRLKETGQEFDIIFLDPPYRLDLIPRLRSGLAAGRYNESLAKKTLQTIDAYDILAPNGFVIVQHFKKDELPVDLGVLSLFRQSHYGDTLVSFFRKGKC